MYISSKRTTQMSSEKTGGLRERSIRSSIVPREGDSGVPKLVDDGRRKLTTFAEEPLSLNAESSLTPGAGGGGGGGKLGIGATDGA